MQLQHEILLKIEIYTVLLVHHTDWKVKHLLLVCFNEII